MFKLIKFIFQLAILGALVFGVIFVYQNISDQEGDYSKASDLVDKVLSSGEYAENFDLEELRKRAKTRLEEKVEENKEAFKDNMKEQINEMIQDIADGMKEKVDSKFEGEKEADEQEKEVSQTLSPPSAAQGCRPGYHWDEKTGVGCQQSDCEEIPGASYSDFGQCVCGQSDSLNKDLNESGQACSRSSDYSACSGCLYACVKSIEDCQ